MDISLLKCHNIRLKTTNRLAKDLLEKSVTEYGNINAKDAYLCIQYKTFEGYFEPFGVRYTRQAFDIIKRFIQMKHGVYDYREINGWFNGRVGEIDFIIRFNIPTKHCRYGTKISKGAF